MTWNFDMSAAPKSFYEDRVIQRKGEDVKIKHLNTRRIIAADDKQTVTVSYWIPDQERWSMFTKDHPPTAWQPWPEHFNHPHD